MRAASRRCTVNHHARLAALWFGIQFVWGAILAVSLQARSSALAPHDGLAAYALIAACGALVGMATQLASGPLADREFARVGHRRSFYGVGVGVAVPALLWFYLAPDYGALVAAFFLLQFGMNVVSGPFAAIVPDYVTPQRTGAAASWMGTLAAVGNAGGLLLAGFVENRFVVALALCAGLVLSALTTVRATVVATAITAAREPLRISRDFRTLLCSRTAINFGFYTLLGFLFFYVARSLKVGAGGVRATTALLFLTFTLTNAAGAVMGAGPVDRFDKRAVVLGANGVVAIGLLGLVVAPNVPFAFASAAVAGLGWGAYFLADWALACSLLPLGAMASAMAVWNVAATLPQIVAPLVTAPVVERADAWSPGAGPRLAIAVAIAQFTFGALWLRRLPRDGGR